MKKVVVGILIGVAVITAGGLVCYKVMNDRVDKANELTQGIVDSYIISSTEDSELDYYDEDMDIEDTEVGEIVIPEATEYEIEPTTPEEMLANGELSDEEHEAMIEEWNAANVEPERIGKTMLFSMEGNYLGLEYETYCRFVEQICDDSDISLLTTNINGGIYEHSTGMDSVLEDLYILDTGCDISINYIPSENLYIVDAGHDSSRFYHGLYFIGEDGTIENVTDTADYEE